MAKTTTQINYMKKLQAILNKLDGLIKLNLFYRDSPRKHYYASIVDKANLHQIFQQVRCKTESVFNTDSTILFKKLDLNSGMYEFVKRLGVPKYKSTTFYHNSRHNTYIYKTNFQGHKAKIVIHTLDNTILTCAYDFEIINTEQLNQIKLAFFAKYNLPNTNSDEFLVIDKKGNKLLFKHQFNLVLTYINSEPEIEEMISSVFEKAHIRREMRYQVASKKLEMSL